MKNALRDTQRNRARLSDEFCHGIITGKHRKKHAGKYQFASDLHRKCEESAGC